MSKVCQFNHCTLEAAFLHQLLSHPPLVPRKAIPCTKRQIQLGWYTRKVSPVPMVCLSPFGTQKGLQPYVFLSYYISWHPTFLGVRN